MLSVYLIFLETAKTIFQSSYVYHVMVRANSSYSTALPILSTVCLSHSIKYVIVPHCDFNIRSPNTNNGEHLFMCFFAICIST